MESHKPENPTHIPERRSERRFEVELPLEYRRASASKFQPGHTLNFSEDGFMLSVSEQMVPGEEIEVKVYFTSPSGLVTVAAIAEVVWSDADAKEDGCYTFGLRYLDISPADKENLRTFLSMYADPHRAGAEMKPGAEKPFKPRKECASEKPGGMDGTPPASGFLKRFINLGRRATGKAEGV